MGWGLKNTGSTGASVQGLGWTPTPNNWAIVLDLVTSANITTDQFIAGYEGANGGSRSWKLFMKDGNMGLLHNASWTVAGFLLTPIAAATRYTIKVEQLGNQFSLYLNGALAVTGVRAATSGGSTIKLNGLLKNSGGTLRPSASTIYSVKLYDSGVYQYGYYPDLANGVGTQLPADNGQPWVAIDQPQANDAHWVYVADTVTTTLLTLNYIASGSVSHYSSLLFYLSSTYTSVVAYSAQISNSYNVTIDTVSSCSTDLNKFIHKYISYLTSSTADVNKAVEVSKQYTAVGEVAQDESLVTYVTSSYTGIGLVSYAALFIQKGTAVAGKYLKRISIKLGIGI